MDILVNFLDIVMHIDKYFTLIAQQYGILTYIILFFIIFCETGLVVTPFLPGDTVLFTAAALAGIGAMDIFTLLVVGYFAALLGDISNYYIGRGIGNKLVEKDKVRLINKEYFKKAQKFYVKHGLMTIIVARFIPLIRTLAPFVAGIGQMSYLKFISCNMIGGGLWISILLVGGYFFGNLSFVKDHFSLALMVIITISFMPGVILFLNKHKNGVKDIPNTEN